MSTDLWLHHRYRRFESTDAQWTRTVDPLQEPLTVLEAKQHARITQATDDVTIDHYIRAAREEAETAMNRGLFTQTWQLNLRSFADVLSLPMAAPLQNDPGPPSTAPVIQYYDTDGNLQTLATTVYTVDTVSRPGRIVRASGQFWPALQPDRRHDRVQVTYVVGWTDPALIPERIKQGCRMWVAYLNCDREGLEQYAENARKSAYTCWNDRVEWIEPVFSCRG